MTALRGGISWAGIVTGPVAWLISTQANYAIGSWPCANRHSAVIWVALALALLALTGGLLSSRALRRNRAAPGTSPRKPRSEHLVAIIGTSLAALFALVIALHGVAGIIFSGCEQ